MGVELITNPTRLILIDDDLNFCALLNQYLTKDGYEVVTCHDGRSGLLRVLQEDFACIILDVMLPEKNGFDVLRELRTKKRSPVLMLTARGDDADSIIGLELGADDYLSKPCNPKVLSARLNAIIRRAEQHGENTDLSAHNRAPSNPRQLKIGALHLNTNTRIATIGTEDINLTSTEFSVLEVLLREAGNTVSKNDLSLRALGRPFERMDRSLDMHISNLRFKLSALDKHGHRPETIKTVHGQGYLFSLPD